MTRRKFIQRAGKAGLLTTLGSRSSQAASAAGAPASISDDQAATWRRAAVHPFSIHPENPKYFLFQGKPRVLIAATEHYGSIVNRRFDFSRYLAEAADKKQTVTRTFLLYRELQSARNPYSSLKVESPDFVAPWPRTGPGRALDGEPIYDLDQWNPEYFARLHQFLTLAASLGIVAELTVFSNTYYDAIWALNPLRDRNNLQGVGKIAYTDYNTLRDNALVERQKSYARKIIQETSIYDNIYYEICNEPGGGLPNHPTADEVDAWQVEMGRVMREELHKLNRNHLLSGQNAFHYQPHFGQPFDASFDGTMLDIVNIHPLPDLKFHGQTYQLSNFMSKELNLAQFRDFFLATSPQPKPCVSDEDNAASMYLDDTGWTIHRKRAWMAVMTGAHYDYIDFSIIAGREEGTKESRAKIRSWMRNLSEFIHSFDFIHSKPLPSWIETAPDNLVTTALAAPGDYVAYLADSREVTARNAGQPISGPITFSLPEGAYRVSLYSPVSGSYSPALSLRGGKPLALDLAPFEHDVALRAVRGS